MPRFEPFPGLRYDPERVRLDEVISPPYDVISPEEQAALMSRSAYNAVRIDLPDAAPGLGPYQSAAARIDDWQAAGILHRDPDCLYGYRMTYADAGGHPRRTIGVIGALGLEPPGAGIFPHERTTPKARSDRLQLLRATRVNTSPIWALSLATGLSDLLSPPARPDGVVDSEGTSHELWPIAEPAAVAAITGAVSAAPLILADGHHRFETALAYQQQRRLAAPEAAGAAGYDSVMTLVVELVGDQLSVQGIHRLLRSLEPDFDVVAVLAEFFELTPTAPPDATIIDRMVDAGGPALVTPKGSWLLRATARTLAAGRQDLDSSRLEVALAFLPEHDVIYQHGWKMAVGAVDRGAAQAAVLLRAVTVEQIASTARGGDRMPPKTTFFWPKPCTGLVFREVPG